MFTVNHTHLQLCKQQPQHFNSCYKWRLPSNVLKLIISVLMMIYHHHYIHDMLVIITARQYTALPMTDFNKLNLITIINYFIPTPSVWLLDFCCLNFTWHIKQAKYVMAFYLYLLGRQQCLLFLLIFIRGFTISSKILSQGYIFSILWKHALPIV